MTTLCELLDGLHYESWSDGDLADVVREHLKVWAYGEVRECRRCGGKGVVYESSTIIIPLASTTSSTSSMGERRCPVCHGTREVRGPGLVERVLEAFGGPGPTLYEPQEQLLLAVLLAELGEGP
jgi:hypothetical protein